MTGHYVTPLVFSVNGGNYTLAAVYQSIYATSTGSNTDALSLIAGCLNPNTTYVFGFCDQQVISVQDRAPQRRSIPSSGTIPFDDSSSGDWVYTALGEYSPVDLSMGLTFSTNSGSADGGLNTGHVLSASMSFSQADQ